MLTLGIHCAGANCNIALLDGIDRLATLSEPMKRGHDERLPMLTEALLHSARLSVADINAFAVCVGPGSFTGIRVGVAFARGLALANGTTAIGVTSLEAMVHAAAGQKAIAVLPAKQRPPDLSFWTQGFQTSSLSDPIEIGADTLAGYFTADTVGIAPDDLLNRMSDLIKCAGWVPSVSDAEAVARFAASSEKGDHRPASPVYARDPDAVPAPPLV